MFLQITVSYIDSSRGGGDGHGGEDVLRGRACHRIWHNGQRGVWGIVLVVDEVGPVFIVRHKADTAPIHSSL